MKTNGTLQDFVLQGFCTSGLSLDGVIDFEAIDKRDVVGIVPPVVPVPGIVAVPFSVGQLERDFVLSAPRLASLNIAHDAVDFAFASDVPVRGGGLPVFAGGFDAVDFGLPETWLWDTWVNAGAFETDGWGRPKLFNRNQVVLARGWSAVSWGRGVIWNVSRSFTPIGFDAAQWGSLNVSPRFVYLRGWDGTLFGRGAAVDYFSREIRAKDKGIDAAQWGVAWLSHDRRTLVISGWDKAQMGRPWVSFGARAIEPMGFLAQDFRLPKVGGAQTIAPEGWDSAAWGGRIVPERLLLEGVQGFDAAICGQGQVFHRMQILALTGFELADKFGHTVLTLMRQYIRQVHSGDSGLVPPVLEGWTSVVNRNRTVSSFGIAPLRVAEPAIVHAARALAAVAWDAADFGRGMVAFRLRDYCLDGIEPMRISDWHSVHNAARVLQPFGIAADGVMLPEIQNTRRAYRWITAGETAALGTAMVDFAVRTLAPYQGIVPEYIPYPTVFNSWQFVQVNGFDAFCLGAADTAIHWNIIAPKAHFQAVFGWADVRNVTPQLYFTGKDMALFGQPDVGLWTRYIKQFDGINEGAVGVPVIADRRKTLLPAGWLSLRFGRANVWHLTTPVQYSRVVYPESIFRQPDDFGIPDLHKNTLKVSGMAELMLGKPSVWSNTVRVDLGVGTDGVGEPRLTLRHRVVDVHKKGIFGGLGVSNPVVSPMTIWCRGDTPSQARNNHKGYWLDVDAHLFTKWGTPKLTLRGKRFIGLNGTDMARFGGADVQNRKQYVRLNGWHNGRMGWVIVGDGTQTVEAFNGADTATLGAHHIGFVPSIHRQVLVRGRDALEMGVLQAALWRQNVAVQGMQSMVFGSSRESGAAYMPQTLAVYFPKPVQPESWDSALFGATHIGLFMRLVSPEGWDSLVSEYDLMYFQGRMRVLRGTKAVPARTIQAQGFHAFDAGIGDVSHKVRFIRPDGFMDNFRKGVANV